MQKVLGKMMSLCSMISLKPDGGLIIKTKAKKDLDIVSHIGLLTMTRHDTAEAFDSWEQLECGDSSLLQVKRKFM